MMSQSFEIPDLSQCAMNIEGEPAEAVAIKNLLTSLVSPLVAVPPATAAVVGRRTGPVCAADSRRQPPPPAAAAAAAACRCRSPPLMASTRSSFLAALVFYLQGIKQYDPRVIELLLDLTYRTSSDLLQDAEVG